MKRYWVNQPSTLQPYHRYHGMNVLAQEGKEKWVRVWFTVGPVVSMEMDRLALSEGWHHLENFKANHYDRIAALTGISRNDVKSILFHYLYSGSKYDAGRLCLRCEQEHNKENARAESPSERDGVS